MLRLQDTDGARRIRDVRVCWWEDDGQNDHDADVIRGGPNGSLSLTQARENFRRFEASEQRFVGKTRKPLPEEL